MASCLLCCLFCNGRSCSCDTLWLPDLRAGNVEELPEGRIAKESLRPPPHNTFPSFLSL